MIRIVRGDEPVALRPIRAAELAALRALGRPPTSKEIVGYKVVGCELWRAQHYKCCYCEHKIAKAFNDVEHYRPKASADRRPGCSQKHGYWWLAFTWDNLLFACPGCNRSAKNDRFPLNHGSISLSAEALPPGGELPLFLDPCANVNPVEHIEFVLNSVGPDGGQRHWWARTRNGSPFGHMTIEVCDLNRLELRELRSDYFEYAIANKVKTLNDALATARRSAVAREFGRALELLNPKMPYVAFAYDALRLSVPEASLRSAIGKGWPLPVQVGL